MKLTSKTFVKPDIKLTSLILENPSLLLMMEHFDLNFVVHDKTVTQVCLDNNISIDLFLSIANLYNGFHKTSHTDISAADIFTIISFLKRSHRYYKQEKYPEIRKLIDELFTLNETPEIKLVGKFFDEYFEEVTEHLEYEDHAAFPYFLSLIDQSGTPTSGNEFSADEYLDHHTDIESKLIEIKNLLLQHIPIKNDRSIRRRLLFSLVELQYDLTIHSTIEESILIPAVKRIESGMTNG